MQEEARRNLEIKLWGGKIDNLANDLHLIEIYFIYVNNGLIN